MLFWAFWMISDRAVPHIDIFRFNGKNKKSVEFSNYWQDNSDRVNNSSDQITGIDFSKGYFIFRFEWFPDQMLWKINNVLVRKEERGIPDESMYLIFSSGINGENGAEGLPTSLDIDWVRCFESV